MDYYRIGSDELYHHGIKGQRWGVRRFQNEDGSRTSLGKMRESIAGNPKFHKESKEYRDRFAEMERDLMEVNQGGKEGGWAKDPARTTNCAYCSCAYELRRRGYDVEAKQDFKGGVSTEEIIYNMFEGGDKQAYVGFDNGNAMTNSAQVSDLANYIVSTQGDGARGMIWGQYPDGQGGHCMAYEIVGDQMVIMDGQVGEAYNASNGDAGSGNYFVSCNFMRTDNLEVNTENTMFEMEESGDVYDYVQNDSDGENYPDPTDEEAKKKKKKKKEIDQQKKKGESFIDKIKKEVASNVSDAVDSGKKFVSDLMKKFGG